MKIRARFVAGAKGEEPKSWGGSELAGITYGPARELMETYGHIVKWAAYKVDVIE